MKFISVPVTAAKRKVTRTMASVEFMLKPNYGMLGKKILGVKFILCVTNDIKCDFAYPPVQTVFIASA